MSKTRVVIGLDPGFANLGYSVVTWHKAMLHVIDAGVLHTKKSNKKAKVLASEDNFDRARELARELRKFYVRYDVVAICAESMSFPRQASVAAKMAMAWGVIADLCEDKGTALVQATPQRIKKALCPHLKKGASKEDVQKAACALYPEAAAKINLLKKGDWEHAADALAAIITCADSEVMRLVRSFS